MSQIGFPRPPILYNRIDSTPSLLTRCWKAHHRIVFGVKIAKNRANTEFRLCHFKVHGGGLRKRKPAVVESESELLLRTLREEDIPGIIAIDQTISGRAKPEYWRHKLTRYISESKPDAGSDLGYLARVAEIDGEVVGFMIGDIRRWEFGQPSSAWITALGVDPNYQGRGVARRLLAEMLNYYRENGLQEVRTIVEWPDGDLLKFFHSMGFVRGPFVELQKWLNVAAD